MHLIATLIVALGVIVAPSTAAPSHRDISIIISSDDNGGVARSPTIQRRICWMACFPEEPKCPDPWYSKKFGECYTCCSGEENDDYTEVAQPKKHHKEPQSQVPMMTPANTMDDPCWKACFPEAWTCPSGAYSKQFGDCWTCCFPQS